MAGRKPIPLILNIETSTNVCSVSLTGETDAVLSLRENHDDKSHSALLAIFVEEVMNESGFSFKDLSAVSVSMGPGSYTGLRIGVSTAKGICYARSIPLIAVNSLDIITRGFMENHLPGIRRDLKNPILCPMIDARRMEVYTALYDCNGNRIKETSAEIIDENSFGALLKENSICFFGNGAEKCRNTIHSENAFFIPDVYPTAAVMGKLSLAAFQGDKFEDLAYFEPFYLKDFVGTVVKKPF